VYPGGYRIEEEAEGGEEVRWSWVIDEEEEGVVVAAAGEEGLGLDDESEGFRTEIAGVGRFEAAPPPPSPPPPVLVLADEGRAGVSLIPNLPLSSLTVAASLSFLLSASLSVLESKLPLGETRSKLLVGWSKLPPRWLSKLPLDRLPRSAGVEEDPRVRLVEAE
jgi:hypothetical protein